MWAVKAERCFDGEGFRPDGVTVVVEGERIVGVESLAYDVPAGVEVTTYAGTVLPGLIDGHVHLVADSTLGGLERAGGLPDDEVDAVITESLSRQAAAGVTTVRDLGDTRYRTLVARDRRTPGEPRIVAAGPPLTPRGGHCHFLGGVVDGVDEVRASVREHVERGVDLVKVMASGGMSTLGTDLFGVQFTPAELTAAVEETHAAGLRIVAHCHSEAGARHAVAAGVDGLEHATLLTPTGPSTPEDLLATIAEAGITLDPTFGFDSDRVLPPELMPAHVREMVERLRLTPSQVSVARAGQLRAAYRLGIRIVSGLDAGMAPPKTHGEVWRAVLQLLDSDLPVVDALATATSLAADDCRLGDTTGRLRPGLAADLLVVDGDLAGDPGALGRPVAVWVRGLPVTPG